jgi:hypothetical protein
MWHIEIESITHVCLADKIFGQGLSSNLSWQRRAKERDSSSVVDRLIEEIWWQSRDLNSAVVVSKLCALFFCLWPLNLLFCLQIEIVFLFYISKGFALPA